MNPLSLNYLEHRSQANWLIGIDNQGIDNQVLVNQTDNLHRQLQDQVSSNPIPRILLIDPDPTNFLAGFLAACMAKYAVFLGNPNWTDYEQQQVLELIQPDAILIAGCWNDAMDFGSGSNPDRQCHDQPAHHPIQQATPGTIMIPTGGSSGRVRFAIHTWNTLMASVWGFQQHFGVDRIHSYCVLPLHHVSGLMQCLRSYASQGQFALQPYKHLLAGQPLDLDLAQFFISLVPTQLQQLLDCDNPTPTGESLTQWLKQSRVVLVGGAPIWQSLWTKAYQLGLPLAPTYGMTETASQVATLLPSEFLAGKTGNGRSLPHAQLIIQDPNGNPLPPGTIGTIVIQSPSLCLGYVEGIVDSPFSIPHSPFPSNEGQRTKDN